MDEEATITAKKSCLKMQLTGTLEPYTLRIIHGSFPLYFRLYSVSNPAFFFFKKGLSKCEKKQALATDLSFPGLSSKLKKLSLTRCSQSSGLTDAQHY